MEAQFAELAGNPDVIVATPGRLAHHLEEVAGFGLKTVEYIVFDEADRWASPELRKQQKNRHSSPEDTDLCLPASWHVKDVAQVLDH